MSGAEDGTKGQGIKERKNRRRLSLLHVRAREDHHGWLQRDGTGRGFVDRWPFPCAFDMGNEKVSEQNQLIPYEGKPSLQAPGPTLPDDNPTYGP
ncbi:hypothetical protein L249_6341 [Ophiocordyceps polyrhachis-furcata BCC 54312]|uniref:Uncharacterized protein n=1 Tax=Ophiocordyceps polyrhachis-furcata BCC 54312 TaxID=1330021 RepID=A0A367L1B3_9HYPO|nr:hypothetical protein L249_6341 [Ophiocordyceps polyrhachis-furcata BCC 54312]